MPRPTENNTYGAWSATKIYRKEEVEVANMTCSCGKQVRAVSLAELQDSSYPGDCGCGAWKTPNLQEARLQGSRVLAERFPEILEKTIDLAIKKGDLTTLRAFAKQVLGEAKGLPLDFRPKRDLSPDLFGNLDEFGAAAHDALLNGLISLNQANNLWDLASKYFEAKLASKEMQWMDEN